MDRKAWIVISLCAVLLGLNFYYTSKQQAARARIAKETKAAAAVAAADSQAKATTTSTGQPGAAATAAGTAPTQASEETRELKAGDAVFVFTTRGGGIKKAILSGTDQITLNELGKEPIGALRREARLPDDIAYKIVESTDTKIVFEGSTADKLLVRKTYSMSDGEPHDHHLLNLSITLTNQGTTAVASDHHFLYAGAAVSLRPDDIVYPSVFWNDGGDSDQRLTTWFSDTSGTFSSARPEMNDTFQELRFGGVMSRFYTTMISHITENDIPTPGRVWAERFKVDHSNDEFKGVKHASEDYAIHGAVGLPPLNLEPATGTTTLNYQIYVGPREYHRLSDLGGLRTTTMFYGWTKPVSVLFVHLMRWFHNLVSNWGWAIVLMTITVRICTWPVFAASMKQAKKMSKLSPLMKEIQEKYKEDPQRQSQETMRLYKDYGINPLGCLLPMVLQILIFSGFYRVLQVAAELRGQSFAWAHDLSLSDTVGHLFGFPINPLPLLMGASTMLQMKLTPQAPGTDKTQQRIMMFMPLIFVYICYNFASALALYYTTQNIFGIFQSWAMRKMQKDDDSPLKKVPQPDPAGTYLRPQGGPGDKEKKKKKGGFRF